LTGLLDANVLIALVVADHIHHARAESWLTGSDGPFATCPITEGSLVRVLVRQGQSGSTVQDLLSALGRHRRHQFWPDDVSYRDVALGAVIGHRQVTDAYLAQLARSRGGRLVSFDRALAATHRDLVELIPTGG
jgi:toxin-antitoxin system PIN domain toxin